MAARSYVQSAADPSAVDRVHMLRSLLVRRRSQFDRIPFRRRRIMRKTIVVAAAAFLVGTGACLAQPAGVTRDMISRALPLEGAPKAEPGSYQVTSEPAFGSPGLQVNRPAALDAFPAKDTLPV